MTVPTILDTCRPRPGVLDGTIADADFAADLALVLSGKASAGYRDAVPFFANTYPTRGLKDLLANVCRSLSRSGDGAAAIFRLDTSYGGGKTHGLIALSHAATGMDGVPQIIVLRIRLKVFNYTRASMIHTSAEGVKSIRLFSSVSICMAVPGSGRCCVNILVGG